MTVVAVLHMEHYSRRETELVTLGFCSTPTSIKMANTTQRDVQIHGKNPQFLIEKVIRSRIWDSLYWKEHCFGLNAVSIIDRAANLKFVGGTFGGHNQPTEFICLVLKLLQLQPGKEIILEYLRADDFKYVEVRAIQIRA